MKNLKIHTARNPNRDVEYKTISEMRATTECVLDGCNRLLTHFQGPGSMQLCREHQIRQRAYGGPGRLDRPWTFWKKDSCESCGRTPSKDNPKIAKMKEPLRTALGRMMLQVDHISASKEKNNHPDNLMTLCSECHQLKSYQKGDHLNLT